MEKQTTLTELYFWRSIEIGPAAVYSAGQGRYSEVVNKRRAALLREAESAIFNAVSSDAYGEPRQVGYCAAFKSPGRKWSGLALGRSSLPFRWHLPCGPYSPVRRGSAQRSVDRAPGMAGMLRTRAVGGGGIMNEHSFLVEDQKFVAPIRCSECDDKRVTRANVASNLRAWGYLTESFEDRLWFTGETVII